MDHATIAESKATSFITASTGKVPNMEDTQIETVKGGLKKNFQF